jgi:hypothetical protein
MKLITTRSRRCITLLFTMVSILYLPKLQAQTITWSFVNAAGFDEGPDMSLRWTIGEPMTTETSGEQGSLRMGFLSFTIPADITAVKMQYSESMQLHVSPNPTTDFIQVTTADDARYLVRILSLSGVPMLATDMTRSQTIDTRSLSPGTYVLYALDNTNNTYQSTTFIKL